MYRITKKFPKEELYAASSQIRRAVLSVALNYTEGYARRREKVFLNFVVISYGSLRETVYLIKFAAREKWISEEEAKITLVHGDEIGAMLWGILKKLEK